MKHFLRKTGSIAIIFVLGLLCFILVVHLVVRVTASFELPKNTEFLIIGHSHPTFAYNDKLIENTVNLSSSAESYFYSYQKLKEVLPKNNIKAVFIEYTNNQIIQKMDDWIWGYEKLNQFLPWHSSFMNNEDLKFLLKKNNSDFIRVISTSTLKNFIRILTFDYSIGKKFGGYKKMERTSTAEELRKEALHNPEIKDSIGISDNNIEYLQKMVDYCSQRNVNVYFIRSPQHQYYVRSNERQLMAIKIDKFKNIDLLDFDRFPLKAKYFADAGHLNASGATIFSNWFNGLLQKGLITQKSKEEFVKKELETVKKIK